MRKIHLLAAVLAVTAAPAVLAAQGDAPKAGASKAAPAPAKPGVKPAMTPEQQASVRRAATILRAFNLAFESKEVQQPVKGALLVCLYNNKLSEITAATDRALAANPAGKEPDATSIYRAAAGVCGVKFEAKAAVGAPKPANPPKTGDSR